MTDGLRKSHLRKAHQVGLSEVGLPDIYLINDSKLPDKIICWKHFGILMSMQGSAAP